MYKIYKNLFHLKSNLFSFTLQPNSAYECYPHNLPRTPQSSVFLQNHWSSSYFCFVYFCSTYFYLVEENVTVLNESLARYYHYYYRCKLAMILFNIEDFPHLLTPPLSLRVCVCISINCCLISPLKLFSFHIWSYFLFCYIIFDDYCRSPLFY